MSEKYKTYDKDKAYFITITVVGWIDVFIRKNHKLAIVDSLRYCQQEKGLVLLGYCIMSSHVHLIAKADGEYNLSEIIRDFKKFTAKKIIQQINDEPESRREWMMKYFEQCGTDCIRNKEYKFWQDGFHPEIIVTKNFFYQKLEYIHNNPVKEMIVEKPEDYLFSSARNYSDMDGLLEIVRETPRLITYV